MVGDAKTPAALFVGGTAARDAIRAAVARVQYEPVFADDPADAQRRLTGGAQTALRAVFVDMAQPDAAGFIAWLRGEGSLFAVPAVATVARVADDVYNDAHAVGADDVALAGDLGGVTRRLANLRAFDPSVRPKVTEGVSIVAHPDIARRRILGRILRQAGFDLSFADSGEDLARVAAANAPRLIVAAVDLPPAGSLEAIRSLRAGGVEAPAVILDRNAVTGEAREDVNAISSAAVGSDLAPPDHLLFLANELLRPGVKDLRASERILFGALCGFRPAGSMEPVFGLTYNLSREGLYVRTLDPPNPNEELWFEMRPPHRREAIHLRGTVVWRRGFDRPGGAVPPGFGLRIAPDRCPADDLRAYHEAYEALGESRIAFHA